MSAQNPLEPPPDKVVQCSICGEPLKINFIWFELGRRWIQSSSVHAACWEEWNKKEPSRNVVQLIPPHYREISPVRFDHKVLAQAGGFRPDNAKRILAIIGQPRKGKTQLAWWIIARFFRQLEEDTGYRRWVDYFLFTELMADYDKTRNQMLMGSKYLFVDDIGCVESYGRDRAALQAVIRSRISQNRWTFLTIDNLPSFDPGLEEILQAGAVNIVVE